MFHFYTFVLSIFKSLSAHLTGFWGCMQWISVNKKSYIGRKCLHLIWLSSAGGYKCSIKTEIGAQRITSFDHKDIIVPGDDVAQLNMLRGSTSRREKTIQAAAQLVASQKEKHLSLELYSPSEDFGLTILGFHVSVCSSGAEDEVKLVLKAYNPQITKISLMLSIY